MRDTKLIFKQIEQRVLFHFLPELEHKLRELGEGVTTVHTVPGNGFITAVDQKTADVSSNSYEHLRVLVRYLKEAYAPTVERLKPLLESTEITYDLLGALFKPGCFVYTKCLGTQKSRCVVFDAGEEVKQKTATYFKLECHFVDHDGHQFGEVGVQLRIIKFRGGKSIHTLDAFPLQYHPEQSQTKQRLVERGRKFCDLSEDTKTKTPIQHCQGRAFYMKNGRPQAVCIDSRVAVDAGLFNKMQPNYRRPCVSDCWGGGLATYGITVQEIEHREELETLKATGLARDSMTDDDLLICCPTVRCFSLTDKMFCKSYLCLSMPFADKFKKWSVQWVTSKMSNGRQGHSTTCKSRQIPVVCYYRLQALACVKTERCFLMISSQERVRGSIFSSCKSV